MERLQSQLKTSESSNTQLKEKVDSMEEELREANLERDGLRSLNERSSVELRRALEVCERECVRERERERRTMQLYSIQCLKEDQKVELQTYMQSRCIPHFSACILIPGIYSPFLILYSQIWYQ